MHVLLVHNDYGVFSGEEYAIESIERLLHDHGHTTCWYRRTSAGIGESLFRKADALVSGIYSFQSRRQIAAILDREAVDIVQVQNLYPFISPSVLPVCRSRGYPVVMRCPNYRLFCPNGLHMTKNQVCERCLGGREWHCVLQNCEDDRLKSFGYAARNAFARLTRMILDNVTVFVVLSEFQRQRFVAGGVPPERLAILPNIVPQVDGAVPIPRGETVAFVGRLSEEKGIRDFVAAAARLPRVPFAVAGDLKDLEGTDIPRPPNVTFHGFLSGQALEAFYAHCRIFVSPNKWFEGFPNVIAKAMAYGKPVVASRIGALPEIVAEGRTGLLFAPGNVEEMVEKIAVLWDRPETCQDMGEAGREKATAEYSRQVCYQRLIDICAQAKGLVDGSVGAGSGGRMAARGA
jgi:glycosyltransferase involved in cell wall biosynthesis